MAEIGFAPAPLIPPPRAHLVRYRGVLAPCTRGRGRADPTAPEAALHSSSTSKSDVESNGAGDGGGEGETLVGRASFDLGSERSESLTRRITWAELSKRVFEVEAMRCPACGGWMRLIAAITNPSVARRSLECLARASRGPPRMREDPGSDFDESGVEACDKSDEA